MTPKMRAFLATSPQTPCLVTDVSVVEQSFVDFRLAFPTALIHYAVKANPAPEILQSLVSQGSGFDAASVPEIEACLEAGAQPRHISYGNTVKKAADVARAYALGIRLYAVDTLSELQKIAQHAPGSGIYVRIAVDNSGAAWPLARKFGASLTEAKRILLQAHALGVQAEGMSFHVGSQQTDPKAYGLAIEAISPLFLELRAMGLPMRLLNIGGGFPVVLQEDVPLPAAFALEIFSAMRANFSNDWPILMMEPGRALVAKAGVLCSEVVLSEYRDPHSPVRWVYLDVGRFGGLAETEGEAIQYRITSDKAGPVGPVVLAGPTCDGADILYENTPYALPLNLKEGDWVYVHATGAYTWSYAARAFNGFAPLVQHVV